jgi:hypothetical protein
LGGFCRGRVLEIIVEKSIKKFREIAALIGNVKILKRCYQPINKIAATIGKYP